jgi:hypothetical protein
MLAATFKIRSALVAVITVMVFGLAATSAFAQTAKQKEANYAACQKAGGSNRACCLASGGTWYETSTSSNCTWKDDANRVGASSGIAPNGSLSATNAGGPSPLDPVDPSSGASATSANPN